MKVFLVYQTQRNANYGNINWNCVYYAHLMILRVWILNCECVHVVVLRMTSQSWGHLCCTYDILIVNAAGVLFSLTELFQMDRNHNGVLQDILRAKWFQMDRNQNGVIQALLRAYLGVIYVLLYLLGQYISFVAQKQQPIGVRILFCENGKSIFTLVLIVQYKILSQDSYYDLRLYMESYIE